MTCFIRMNARTGGIRSTKQKRQTDFQIKGWKKFFPLVKNKQHQNGKKRPIAYDIGRFLNSRQQSMKNKICRFRVRFLLHGFSLKPVILIIFSNGINAVCSQTYSPLIASDCSLLIISAFSVSYSNSSHLYDFQILLYLFHSFQSIYFAYYFYYFKASKNFRSKIEALEF